MPDTTPDRRILTPDQTDDLAQAILSLTRELWVVHDRVLTLEAVLEKHGIAATQEIEAYEPSSEEAARRLEISSRAVKSVIDSLGVGAP